MLDHKQLLTYAQTYGTPLFVYDADLVRERYRDLYRFIPYPKLEIHYALKANYQIGILEALRDEGCGIDAVSPAEVELALKLGFAKESIIYTANNTNSSGCSTFGSSFTGSGSGTTGAGAGAGSGAGLGGSGAGFGSSLFGVSLNIFSAGPFGAGVSYLKGRGSNSSFFV